MTDVSVIAEKNDTVYNVPIQMGMNFFNAKFDTRSSATVITASVFYDEWSDKETQKMKIFCESKGCSQREFTSASEHKLIGYSVVAKDVLIGDTNFKEFHYYLITNGRKEISLIGDDFIENCRYTHEPHYNIEITKFDFDSYCYCSMDGNFMNNDEVLSFIDDLVG